jgi:hypothetical protein
MKRAATLVSAAVAALVAACGIADSRTPLFPLEAGHEWNYRLTTRWDNDEVDTETRVIRALGEDHDSGAAAWHRRDEAGIDYWIRHDASGIWRAAAKSDADPAPVADPEAADKRRYVLRDPVKAGTQWSAATTVYLLRRRNEYPPELKYRHPNLPMAYAIESTDERVATPAGQWASCVKVHGTATVHVYADSVNGWRDLPIDTLEWYCPGVGLVKLERRESANSAFLLGGTLSMELTAWR